MAVLGLDTSNYTTSAAWFDGENGDNAGKLLQVPEGSLGLRQSDALFQHVKRLPAILEQLKETGLPAQLKAIGASTQPREVEGSYMPCFLAGESQAKVMSTVLELPFYPCSRKNGSFRYAASGVAFVRWDNGVVACGPGWPAGTGYLHWRDL